jgi:soluble lytic murein transglycosylase-like protein
MPKPTKEEVILYIRTLCGGLRLNPDLAIRQCERESAFDQDAVSPCGAIGLMQLMPATATWLKVDPHVWQANVKGALQFMQSLLIQYKWDYAKALAAYNWGPGNLNKAIKAHGDAWRTALPKETADYLTFILQ